jgi:hypothetical protein
MLVQERAPDGTPRGPPTYLSLSSTAFADDNGLLVPPTAVVAPDGLHGFTLHSSSRASGRSPWCAGTDLQAARSSGSNEAQQRVPASDREVARGFSDGFHDLSRLCGDKARSIELSLEKPIRVRNRLVHLRLSEMPVEKRGERRALDVEAGGGRAAHFEQGPEHRLHVPLG